MTSAVRGSLGAQVPAAPGAAAADEEKETSLMGDRRGLGTRTSVVRTAALFGLATFLLAVLCTRLFFSFDTAVTVLLIVSIGHLLIAPLAFIATLVLGTVLDIVLYVAVAVFLADAIQLLIRAFYAEASIEFIVLLTFNVALLAVSTVYLVSIVKLRKLDTRFNGRASRDFTGKRLTVIRQQANALRAIAIFDVVAVVVVLLLVALLGDSFANSSNGMAFFLLGHIVVAAGALVVAPQGGCWLLTFATLLVLQTALDLLHMVLRVLDSTISILSIDSVLAATLLIVTVLYIVVDTTYLTLTLTLMRAIGSPEDTPATEEASPTQTTSKAYSGPTFDIVGANTSGRLRQRKEK